MHVVDKTQQEKKNLPHIPPSPIKVVSEWSSGSGSCRSPWQHNPEPSHASRLSLAGFQPCTGPLSLPVGPTYRGSLPGLWWLWFGTQDPDVRRSSESWGQTRAGLQRHSPKAPQIGGSIPSLIQIKIRAGFSFWFFLSFPPVGEERNVQQLLIG